MHRTTRPRGRALAAAIVAGALLAACSSEPPPTESVVSPVPDTAEDGAAEPEQPEEPAAETRSVEVDLEIRTRAGSTFRVTGLEVTEDAVLVDVDFVIGGDQAFVQLNNSSDPAVLVDDLGNEYALVPPEGDSAVTIDGGQRLQGTLVYEGPLAPDARTVQLLFNREREFDGRTVNDRIQPRLDFPPIPLDGTPPQDAGSGVDVEPFRVEVDLEVRNAGSVFRVTAIEVTDTNILVDVRFTISQERTYAAMNTQFDPAVVVDDLGNEYDLLRVEDSAGLIIDGGEELEGTLAFQGPLQPGASTLQVLFNRDSTPDGGTSNDRLRPNAEFPAVEIPAGGGTGDAGDADGADTDD